MIALADLLKRLDKYSIKGEFILSPEKKLAEVCNIPIRSDYSGLYLFYNHTELIYVGISGREGPECQIIHRRDGLRGRFLTGKQFGDRRSKTLPKQMLSEGISSLRIKWFVTFGGQFKELPRPLEKLIIEAYKNEHGGLRPKWNKKD